MKFRLTNVFFARYKRGMANHPLREYRKNAGLTLQELSVKTGVSAASLCRIELRQQWPSLKLISRLIKVTRGALRADDFLAK
jgi:transcriptional regulator with XRE-family HTH domain